MARPDVLTSSKIWGDSSEIKKEQLDNRED